ncbi:hypothetical protein AA0242T_2184 [Acetobacter aceti NRIC 0242]|uniref:Uncharacterized protein n=1 Tax=Acetobacter aceti NBRC 14818 TaxID=887700 RepID=A0AB33IJ73_ACEAC|nr:hypothetical protein [Acetobacter aceti]TCS29651.1 hypothetical protein EDC15_12036 [Acetobacter aceti NBRC 14818]BCK77150.1 hypothetical protein EMQ_2756 [Acetobacter aceti NBRC 14818]GAN57841.1 hypothetical protein Abac_021_006 [Acetobacter aceti NBRC 14818]GBO81482.1 hypothetical protein AA0242T_2184 [Acetobacter aceti NRIC 0242]
MSKIAERQKFIRHWMEVTGESEVDMLSVARMAKSMGWKAPAPITEEERLAKQFRDAARQDIRRDRNTGRPYRGYHAVPRYSANGQLSFSYMDIDDPKAKPDSFRKACVMRREQTIGDVLQLRLDQHHWNDQRPPEQHVELLPADMEFDVELRLAGMDDEDDAA